MSSPAGTGLIPNRINCYERLMRLEAQFDVSLHFWVVLQKPPSSEVECWVFAGGSGWVFDRMSNSEGIGRARVLDAQQGDIYQALWAALGQLDHNFKKLMPAKELPALP